MTTAIPEDWVLEPLGTLCSRPQYGLTETASRAPVGPRFLRITDIQDGDVNWESIPFCRCSQADLERHRIERGDLLFARIGATTGKTFLVKECPEDAVFASYLIRLRPHSVHERYLYYFCQSQAYWDNVNASKDERLKGGVNTNLLTQIQVPVPPKAEQAAIAGLLELIETAARCELRIVRKLGDLKSATMAKLFREGLRGGPVRQLNLSEVPESWRSAPLSEVAEIQTGVAKGRQFENTDAVEVPYLRVANVQDGHLDLSEMKTLEIRRAELERYTLRDGDVVLTEGGDFDKLGRGFIWRSELPLCIHQNHVFAVRTNRTVLLPEFFAYLAQSPYGKAYFLQVAHKTTNLACINSNKLKAFPVVLPGLEEQEQIVKILDTIDQALQLHQKRRVAIECLFQSLLEQLMTGTVRVNDLDRTEVSHA